MDLEKLEKMIQLTRNELSKHGVQSQFLYLPAVRAQFENLLSFASEALPDHKRFFGSALASSFSFRVGDAHVAIKYISDLLTLEKAIKSKAIEMKIFEGASDKLEQAGVSFRNADYSSTFHSLNTAFELILKDKLGIPTTITKINTSNIVDILVKHKIDTHLYLAEAKKRVLMIDNKIKHQGYSPSKIDCINGIKAMEEVISKLRDKEIELSEEVRNKIYEGL